MNLRHSRIAIIGLLGLPFSVQAASFTYHGDLMDGDAPANGRYDLRVRAFAQPNGTKLLGAATELPQVAVTDGRFSVALNLPEDADGVTWVDVSVRKSDGDDDYTPLGEPQPLAKANSTCPGAWALDGNSGAPVGSYLGHADNRSLFLSAPKGVTINQATDNGSGIDLTVRSNTNGNFDGDMILTSVNGDEFRIRVPDQSSLVQFDTNATLAERNAGLPLFHFGGRLMVKAAGTAATDTSGGIWFNDERFYASFMGRGDNQSNWTGIYNEGGWVFSAHDNGAFGFNTGTTALPANTFRAIADGGFEMNALSLANFYDVTMGARPNGGDADFDAGLRSRNGRNARVSVFDSTGVLEFSTLNAIGSTRYSFGGGGNEWLGRYLITGANGAHLTTGGTWTNGSSRTFKHAFKAIDVSDVLARVVAMPLSRWQYRNSSEGEHLGPMAEDFAAAFGLGGDRQHISTVDADGVALAAIQGLNAKLEADNATLRAQLDAVMTRLAALEAAQGP